MAAKEMIDVLDEQGNKTGEILSKKEIHLKGLWHSTAHVWIVNSRGEILLQKRSAQKPQDPNAWTNHGGHVDSGETSVIAACREIKEELGLVASISELTLVKRFSHVESFKNNTFHENEFIDLFVLSKDFALESLKIQTEEVSAVRFFDIAELGNPIAFDGCRIIQKPEEISALREYLNYVSN